MYKIMFVDLETENHEYYGNLASPHHPENYIVAPGWRIDTVQDDGSIEEGEVQYRYFNSKEEAAAGEDWFDAVEDCAILVAHNMQFETQWFLSKHREVFERFLKKGGRMVCTALGHYLVSHQQDLYPALDEVAPIYGGTHKIDAVKILWKQGYKTSQIDRDLLIEYLAGPSGDIENTAHAFYGEMEKLNEMGMWRMFLERSDAVLAFGYCEWFGLYVDQEVAYKNLAEQQAEIERLRAELNKLLPDDLPPELEFAWHNRYHLSALVYGGPVKYRKKVPYDPPQYVKGDFYRTTSGELIEVCNHEALGYPDVERYRAGKNKGEMKVFREDTAEEKLKWGDLTVTLPGLVDLASLDPSLRDKYLGRRAEFRGSQLLPDGVTPVYSTSEDALTGLKAHCPQVKLMLDLATLVKDVSTYYWSATFAEEEHAGASGVPEAVGEGQPGEGTHAQSKETHAAEVRPKLGTVGADANGVQLPVPDMRQADVQREHSAAGNPGSPGPLPRNREAAGNTVPYVQQSTGYDGGHSGGTRKIPAVPKVGVGGCTSVKGMLQFVGPDSIVHHSLNATATVTGRLSSSTPNLQNLPRDGTSKVKQMFTSRFGEAGRIIEVDYSALEVVMLCALTGDEKLLALLQAGTDMHCYRLAYKLGEKYEDVLQKAVKDEAHPEHKKYKQMRTDIKPPSFAAQYGASAEGIAFNTGCSVEFAQEFLDNEAEMFPVSIGYRQVIRDEVERTGAQPDGIHREQTDDGRWIVYRRGYWQAPGGTCYSFRQHPKYDKVTRQSIMDYKDTQIANYWCQGEAGFMMSISMGRIMRHCLSKDWYGGKVCLINNVHDAAYADAANEEVGREAALDMQRIMADAPRYMNEIWPGYNMAHVPFPAAAEMGVSMYDKSHVH